MTRIHIIRFKEEGNHHEREHKGYQAHPESHEHHHETYHSDNEWHEREHDAVHKAECHEEDERMCLPYAKAANMLMSASGYVKYVQKHGYHFTDALAEHASKMMQNANGKEHTWTTKQVMSAIATMGPMATTATAGDITYLANMFYADLFPKALKDDASCVCAAYMVAHDPDGYDGMAFCRWTSDIIGKGVHIEWENFI